MSAKEIFFERKEALGWTTSSLLKEGIVAAEALSEAEFLLADVLNISRTEIYLNFDKPLYPAQRESLCRKVKKRLEGVPVQYILGHQFFRYLDLKVAPGVFIPRPETELLVEHAIRFLDRREEGKIRKVLDLGVGSGAIALSLAYEVSLLEVYALDLSPLALNIARKNARKYGLEKKVKFIKSNLFNEMDRNLKGKFRVIVANPPYISDSEVKRLEKKIVDFEPQEALCGGKDGLDILQRVVKEAPLYLESKGLLALEIGKGQAPMVLDLLQRIRSFEKISVCKDYAGVDRFILAIKRGKE